MPDQAEYVELPIYRDQLADALGFRPSDLQANQAGRLTDSQRATQLKKISRAVVTLVVCLAIAIACLAVAAAVGLGTGLGIQIVLLAGCFFAFSVVVSWFNVPVWRDLRAGTVSNVEGFVRPAERATRINTGPGPAVSAWTYSWVVDDAERFSVPGKAYPALTPARHRLYFLPLSRRIVAAEPLSAKTS